jgi:hypothetical protein
MHTETTDAAPFVERIVGDRSFQRVEELIDNLRIAEDQRHDYVAALGPEREFAMSSRGDLSLKQGGLVTPTGYAHGQIAQRVNIPVKYYNRMLANAGSLLADNVNHWLSEAKAEERVMLRTVGSNLRALVSDRFKSLDNLDLALSLLPALEDAKREHQLYVAQSSLTDRRMYLRLVAGTMQKKLQRGSTVAYGVQISNSEVGAGALVIEEFLYTLQCLNGLVVNRAMRRAHLGGRIETDGTFEEFYSDKTRQLDRQAIFAKAADTVRGLLTQENFDRQLNRLQNTLQNVVPGSVELPKLVEVVRDRLHLSDGEGGALLNRWTYQASEIENNWSQWGMVSAITRSAQDSPSIDRRIEIERMANTVVDMSAADWDRLVAQANRKE